MKLYNNIKDTIKKLHLKKTKKQTIPKKKAVKKTISKKNPISPHILIRDENYKKRLIDKEEAFRLTKATRFRAYHNIAHPTEAPPTPGLAEALNMYERGEGLGEKKTGAGGIETDFPQGDIGQPFWFSNIGANHFPREGFTYRPFDLPKITFNDQVKGYFDDEDARMGVDFLAAKSTGGDHYFKAKTNFLSKYVESWTKDINLNWLNWQIAKELLAFGNCYVRCRVPIWKAKKPEDFQILPIESMVRIWWTPDRRPLWYEFRGAEYNGYFRPGEIIHFVWNQTNGQIFGFGIMAQLTNRVTYLEDTPDGPIVKERESYLDIKHGLQNVTYKVMKRYLPRMIVAAEKTSEETRDAIRDELRVMHDSEDIVHGVKGLKIEMIGNETRPIDPQVFMDMFQSSIFKAVQTSKGRIAGQSQGPSYANGEESAILDEVGLSQFPIQLKFQIEQMIVKPWYEFNRISDPKLYKGLIKVPWKAGNFEMMFGKQTKKDLEPEQIAQWVQLLLSKNQLSNQELRKIAENVGVPELASDIDGEMNQDQAGLSGSSMDGIGLENSTNQMKNDPTGGGMQSDDPNQTPAIANPTKSKFSKA